MGNKFSKRAYLLVASGAGLGVALTLIVYFIVRAVQLEGPPAEEPKESKEALFPVLSPHAEVEFNRDISGDCMIRGTVRNADEQPVSDAQVGVRILWEPWAEPQPPARIETDEQGRFAFKGFSRDLAYQLWVYSPSAGIAQYLEPECGAETDMVLEQGAELTLHFRVLDGPPPGEVRFLLAGDLLWPAREGRTDKQGNVHIIGLQPGEYVLWALVGKWGFISAAPIRLEPGKRAVEEIELQPADEVVIDVLDARGRKLSGEAIVQVAPESASQLCQVTTTDRRGRAIIGGLPQNSYTVSIVSPGHIRRDATSLRPGDKVTLRLAPGGRISGKVALPDGKPISGAEVQVEEDRGGSLVPLPASAGRQFKRRLLVAEKNGFPPLYRIEKNTYTPGPVNIPLPELKKGDKQDPAFFFGHTDDQGSFVLDGLTAGQFVLGAKHAEYVTVERLKVTLQQGETHADGTIVMQPGMSSRIRIVDERGYPIPDAELTAYDTEGETVGGGKSGSDGFALLLGLPETVRVEAQADGRVPAFVEIKGQLGTESTGEISLPPADKTLFGRAIDTNGFGIAEVSIVARATSARLLHVLTTMTENDGTFRLDEVGAGTYDVTGDAGERGQATVGQATFRDEVKLIIGGAASPAPSSQPIVQVVPMRAPQNGSNWFDSEYPPENLGADREEGSAETDGQPAGEETKMTEFGLADTLTVTGTPSVVRAPRGKGGLPLTLGGGGKAVIVKSFKSGSQLAETGISRGDRILEVDGVPVRGLAAARKAIEGPIGSVVMLKVKSEDDVFVVVVQRVKVAD